MSGCRLQEAEQPSVLGGKRMVSACRVQVAAERYQVTEPCLHPCLVLAATTTGGGLRLGPWNTCEVCSRPCRHVGVSAPLHPKNLGRRGRAASPWTFPAITAYFRTSPLAPRSCTSSCQPGQHHSLDQSTTRPDGDDTGVLDNESDDRARETQRLCFRGLFWQRGGRVGPDWTPSRTSALPLEQTPIETCRHDG